MNIDDKFVVTDENEIVAIFDNEEEAQEYAYNLSRKNAIDDIEDYLDDLEPSEEKIDRWIAYRGTVDYRPMTDEDRQTLEDDDEYF